MPFDSPHQPLAPGIIVVLSEAGRSIQVPQMTLGQRDDNEELVDKVGEARPYPPDASKEEKKAIDRESLSILRGIVVIALSRNYPNVTDADLRDFTLTDLKRAVGYALMGPDSGESPAAPSMMPPMNGKLVAAAIN